MRTAALLLLAIPLWADSLLIGLPTSQAVFCMAYTSATPITLCSDSTSPTAQMHALQLARAGAPADSIASWATPDSAFVPRLENGRCPFCVRLMWTSRVEISNYGAATLMACPPGYYDEQGEFHAPAQCNTLTRGAVCSKGHTWTERESTW